MEERAFPIDVGFVPEAAISGGVLIQSEYSAFLIFNAMKRTPGGQFEFEDAGLAVCEFVGCTITKFGYPNDEAWRAIPRTNGLGYEVCEVANSTWGNEIATLNRHAFPNTRGWSKRHFLILFHDSSFECLANDILTELTSETLTSVLSRLGERIYAE